MLFHIDDGDMHKLSCIVMASLAVPVLYDACLAPRPGQGFPASQPGESTQTVPLGILSHHDVGWALPALCKESFTLKLLLAYVLLSKRVAGPCFAAVLLCWISSSLAWCVRDRGLTVAIKTRFSYV